MSRKKILKNFKNDGILLFLYNFCSILRAFLYLNKRERKIEKNQNHFSKMMIKMIQFLTKKMKFKSIFLCLILTESLNGLYYPFDSIRLDSGTENDLFKGD